MSEIMIDEDEDLFLKRRREYLYSVDYLNPADPLEQHGHDPVHGHPLMEPRSKRKPFNPDGSANW